MSRYATNIAKNLKALRKARGLTQAELAEKAEMSVLGYQKIERAEVEEPKYSSIQKLATALGSSPEDLARDSDDLNLDFLAAPIAENLRFIASKFGSLVDRKFLEEVGNGILLSEPELEDLLNGRGKITPMLIQRICDYYGISPDELVFSNKRKEAEAFFKEHRANAELQPKIDEEALAARISEKLAEKSGPSLTSEEQELIILARRLGPKWINNLVETTRVALENDPKTGKRKAN